MKNLLTGCILLITIILQAQNNINRDAEALCECISKADIYTIDELEGIFKNCTLTIINQKESTENEHLNKVKNYLGQNCTFIQEFLKNQTGPQFLEKDRTSIAPIIGNYSLSRGTHQPEGSPKLQIHKSNLYLIYYFGGAQIGTVKVYKNKYAHFIPYKSESPYTIYGRHNPQLKDSTKIAFLLEGLERKTFINMANISKDATFNLVFNEDANCVSYPSTKKFKGTTHQISLAKRSYENPENSAQVIFENPNKYNDLIIRAHKDYYDNKGFIARLDKGGLIIDGHLHKRGRLTENAEKEFPLFQKEVEKSLVTDSLLFCNSIYNSNFSEELIKQIYNYNTLKNMYTIKKEFYQENLDSLDYDNQNIVYKFNMLSSSKKFKPLQNTTVPLIYSVCD